MEQVQVLVGKTVEMVCFAKFSLYIHLESGILLIVESALEHHVQDAQRRYRTIFPIAESGLMTILECSVTSASLKENGDLQLLFSNGDTLYITQELGFESYRLRIGGDEVIA